MKKLKEWAKARKMGETPVFEIWQVAGAIAVSVVFIALIMAAIFPREGDIDLDANGYERVGMREVGGGEYDFLFAETMPGEHKHSEMMIFDNPNTVFAQVVDGKLYVYRLRDIEESLDEITIMGDLTDILKRLSVDNFFWYSSRTSPEAWCFYDGESEEQLKKAGDFLLKKLTPENGQPIKMTTRGETQEALVDGREK